MNKAISITAKCVIAFWLVPVAVAQPSRTTIQDVLYKADGTRLNGLAVITWNSFQAADGTNITQSSVTVAIVNGNFQVQLIPTTNAMQAASYTVDYNSDGKFQFQEKWAVPPSTSALRIQDVRSAAGGLQPPLVTSIRESDVVGLITDLSLRPVKGPGFSANRSARINSAGAIEAVIGSASDCVRTDGTSVPCGASSGGPAFVDAESPAGIVDGSNTIFTLANPPNPASSLTLYRNGLLQKTGMDYSVSGATIQLVAGSGPQPADILVASYRIAGLGAGATVVFVDGETPAGALDGVNSGFTLAGTPNPSASLALFRNGLLQKAGADYSLAGANIQFLPSALPQPGDNLLANYRQ